jgi:hypothetical protein
VLEWWNNGILGSEGCDLFCKLFVIQRLFRGRQLFNPNIPPFHLTFIAFFKISFRLGQNLALSNKDDWFHAKTQSRKENLE